MSYVNGRAFMTKEELLGEIQKYAGVPEKRATKFINSFGEGRSEADYELIMQMIEHVADGVHSCHIEVRAEDFVDFFGMEDSLAQTCAESMNESPIAFLKASLSENFRIAHSLGYQECLIDYDIGEAE